MPARPTSLKAKEARKREPLPGFGSAAARIAYRFAPRAQTSAQPPNASSSLRADSSASRSLADIGISPRTLIGALIALALVPNLTLAAYLWLPALEEDERQPTTAAPSSAPSSTLAAVASRASLRPAEPKTIHPVLTAPAELEASASGEIAFDLALDGTDGVPPRSAIAISGLPVGATLSSGRPYGENGWNLKSDEIGDVTLRLPDNASGETKLAVELISPHGEVISSAETVLKVSASPEIGVEPEPATGASEAGSSEPETDAGPTEQQTAAAEQAATKPPAAPPAIPDPVRLDAPAEAPAPAEVAAAEDVPATREPARSRQPKPMALASAEDSGGDTITPAMFVNLRSGPTSSASVLAVVPKGAKLAVQARKRGWVQVTHPTTAQTGWIYSGNLAGAPRRARRTTKPTETGSFWSYVGRALKGEPSSGSSQN